MGRKCAVDGCPSDSNRTEDAGVTFHRIPQHSDVRPKWLSLCRIADDKKANKIIYICSRHFLRGDFCNFKGRKYMLRQGVLPSVFPWDKSKLEEIKAKKVKTVKSERVDGGSAEIEIKKEPEVEVKQETENKLKEVIEEEKPISSVDNLSYLTVGTIIEALDFNNEWYSAKVIEIDYGEQEVFIQFQDNPNNKTQSGEWISMSSSRLRPLQSTSSVQPPTNKQTVEPLTIGQRCIASWTNGRSFPATVTKILKNGSYEVLFDDGFIKTLKPDQVTKSDLISDESFELQSKRERKDRKRKLNVKQLFNRRKRREEPVEKKVKKEVVKGEPVKNYGVVTPKGEWKMKWENGKPVGTPSNIETIDGPRASIVVSDPLIPPGWNKHLVQRHGGICRNKWDVVIVSPHNRKFRIKADLRKYLDENPIEGVNETMFDFSTTNKSNKKKKGRKPITVTPTADSSETTALSPLVSPKVDEEFKEEIKPEDEEENEKGLKIVFEDGVYKCPIEGCGKIFRKENLAQMHVKHYHPEYTKFMDSTPNVADLAYARTVIESFDSPSRLNMPKTSATKTTTKSSKLPIVPTESVADVKPQSPKHKDSEIIKLLNAKPADQPNVPSLPSTISTDTYPDMKLKDLLNKTETQTPKKTDSKRPSGGIKTLLPVTRQQPEVVTGTIDETLKKRRHPNLEAYDSPVPSPQQQQPLQPSTSDTNTNSPAETECETIIEGGEVIRIVRLKAEEIVHCMCGFSEEDGLMVQCDLCLCWQHAYCNNIEKESQVPERWLCHFCQSPLLGRESMKYKHDQDWLKYGVLPVGNYHAKDEEKLKMEFEKLRQSHDVSAGLVELREYIHSLGVKLKIAEAKNHPKLYLWAKPWDEKEIKSEDSDEHSEKPEDQQPMNPTKESVKSSDDYLMLMLNSENAALPKINPPNIINGGSTAAIIPQPEAAIDMAECRINLLEHVLTSQMKVEDRLDELEKRIEELEEGVDLEKEDDYPRTRATVQMMIKDLERLQEFSRSSSI